MIDTLIELRIFSGLSQKDIAKKMHCSQSRISKLENTKSKDVRLGDLQDYIEALGYTLTIRFFDHKQKLISEGVLI